MDLTDAYDNSSYIPDAAGFAPRWESAAQALRYSLGDRAQTDLPYGSAPRQQFDLFWPEGTALGLVMFIHGGYWRSSHRSVWSHLAAGPLARGWAVAMPSYTIAPEGRISAMTQEVATALAAAADHVEGPVVVTGHSAGGHLSSRMRCGDVDLPDSVATRLARIVPISPLSDLRPLLQTAMNADLRLDETEAEAESPMLKSDLRGVPTHVWVGGDERPVFLDQARWLGAAWPETTVTVVSGKHHFDVIDSMQAADGALTEALVGGL